MKKKIKDSNVENDIEIEENEKNEKRENKRRKRKERARVRLVVFFAAVILFVGFIFNTILQFGTIISEEISSLSNSMYAAECRSNTVIEIEKKYSEYDDEYNMAYLDVLRLYINRNGYEKETLSKTSDVLGEDGYCFYIDGDGTVHKPSTDAKLELEDSEIQTLADLGSLEKNGHFYYAKRCRDDGLVILEWLGDPFFEIIDNSNALEDCQNKAFIFDNDTNRVVKVQSEEEFSLGDRIYYGNDSVMLSVVSGLDKYETMIIQNETSRKIYLGTIMDQGDGTSLVAYCSLHDLLAKSYDNMSYSTILLLLYVILAIVYSVILVRETTGVTHVMKKIYINKAVTHIVSLMLFGSLLMLVLSANMDLLNKYSTQNQHAIENLNYMSSAIENSQELKKAYTDNYNDEIISKADLAGWLYQNDKQVFEEKGIEYIADLLRVKELTIFDGRGQAVLTTTSYDEYILTQNEEDSEYSVRKILSDQAKNLAMLDSDSDTYIAATRRRDDSGAIFVREDNQNISGIDEIIAAESLIKNADFNSSDKILIDENESDVLYWLEPNSNNVEKYDNDLSEEAQKNGYSGFQKIDGISYYINTKSIDGYTMISARTKESITGEFMRNHASLLLEYVIVSLVILIGIGIRRQDVAQEDIPDQEENADNSIIKLDTTLKKLLWRMMFAAAIAMAVTLVVESNISTYPLLSYLIGNDWEKGFNIFGISECWVIIVCAVILSRLLKILIKFVSQNLGAGALTAGHLIISLMQVAIWITAILMCMYQVGVDPKTMLAGVSVTSVVIGIGAQSTVNDIISGFFLVLEGHVRIGDWVSVNGFRGVVTSLGLRTTKISLYGDTISVNNSSMKDVINLSKEPSRIDLHFLVKYGTDVSRIQQLVEDNSERYLADCPKLLTAPHFENMYDMAASGLDMHIWCFCNEKDKSYAHNRVMRTTYEIMNDNGIVIPFTTITIDSSDDNEVTATQE